MADKLPTHLGGHMNRTHIDRGALEFAQTMGCSSMLDIGCGPGGQVKLAREMGMTATGVDGDPNVQPDILHDFCDATLPLQPAVDLAWSCEFLEHVDEKYLTNTMSAFTSCCPSVIMVCGAPPGKKGHHHVNCQTHEYWIKAFTDEGYKFDPFLTEELRSKSTMKREFMRKNGLVFVCPHSSVGRAAGHRFESDCGLSLHQHTSDHK